MTTYYRTYYRLEDSKTELPMHWAYCDAWEMVTGEVVDNRQPGFQVWDGFRVIAVAAGMASSDGDYDAVDYPWLHVIEASDSYHGAGEWFAVEISDVESVKVVPTQKIVEWALSAWKKDVADGYDYEDDFEGWCKDSEEDITEWLKANTEEVAPVFVETLENPYK